MSGKAKYMAVPVKGGKNKGGRAQYHILPINRPSKPSKPVKK